MHGEVTEDINSDTAALIATRVGSIKYRVSCTLSVYMSLNHHTSYWP